MTINGAVVNRAANHHQTGEEDHQTKTHGEESHGSRTGEESRVGMEDGNHGSRIVKG